ncbi:hypothetical protein AGMMS50212_14400 [Spirochaetia bacterium]|nr:hypothetical protein AGMMS50212_14400 [Spirochaetia bacterium]
MENYEIEEIKPVFNEMGMPVNFGWARYPVFKYEPDLCWTPRRLISEIERYIIFSPTHLFMFEAFDGGFSGHLSFIAVSLLDKKKSEKIENINFPMGTLNLPKESSTISIKQKQILFEVIILERGNRILKVDIPEIKGHSNLRGEVVLSEPPNAQEFVSNSRWRGEKNSFQLLQCSPWYSVEGVIQFENTPIVFNQNRACGIYYTNRIGRPKRDFHYWAAACGYQNDRLIGFNIGYGLADSSTGSENAFFVNGHIHKLGEVTFKISTSSWLDPWRFTSSDKRIEMTFIPCEMSVHKRYILFYSLRSVQVFGFFSGEAVLDDGSVIQFRNITGMTERKKTRY